MTAADDKPAAVVTGIAGGIGGALGRTFRESGYFVIGIDRQTTDNVECDCFLEADLASVGRAEETAQALSTRIVALIENRPLCALVNNAAVQNLGSAADLNWHDWLETFYVNVSAPFALARELLSHLQRAHGTIVNIGSVHATATKPGFIAYAVSKAALHGMTRALAVDLGPDVRVVAIAPAAVDTAMLRAGVENQPGALKALEEIHPLGRIAQPDEIARAAIFLASPQAGFITGSVLQVDGGILSRLHDPL